MFSFSSPCRDRRLTTFESILPSYPSIPLEAINEEEDPKDAVERVFCQLEDGLEENDKPLTKKENGKPLTPKEEAEKLLQDLMEALSTEAVLAKLQFLQGVMVENPSMMRALDDPPGELMSAALVCKNRGFWSEDCAKAFQKVFLPLKASSLGTK